VKITTESIRAPRGDAFEVVLNEPPATGHRWRLTDGVPEIAVIGERYDPPPAGGPLGNAGRRVITLRAASPGQYRLRFVLARPGEARREAEHHVEVDAS
jgi:predicted secreted protein